MTEGSACIEYFVLETLLCDMAQNWMSHIMTVLAFYFWYLILDWCFVVTFGFLLSYLCALLLLYSQQYPYMLNAR